MQYQQASGTEPGSTLAPADRPTANSNHPSQSDTRPYSSRQTGLALLSLLLLCVPLIFFQLGGWGLMDVDEGRYAEIPREMLIHHDFVTPTVNYVKFFDKPPLLYWAIAGLYSIFGLHEWVARLAPALAAIAGTLATYALGRRMFGPRAGYLSALMLLTTLMWPMMARFVVTDMLVSASVVGALALWWMGHVESDKRRQTAYFLGFWVAMAMAILSKGVVSLVMVGGGIVLYLLLCRKWKPIGKSLGAMRWGLGVPLLLLLAAPWFILVAQRNPEFNHFFWYEQHVARFLGKAVDRDHVNGPLYFFEFLPLIFFPWSLFMPAAIIAGWKKIWPARGQEQTDKQRAVIYLSSSILFIMLFFSGSDSKLVTYILPVLAPLSILIAAYFDRLLDSSAAVFSKRQWPLAAGVGLLALLCAATGIAAIVAGPKELAKLSGAPTTAILLGLLLLLWAAVILWAAWRHRARGIVASVAGGLTVVFAAGIQALAEVAPSMTTKPLLEAIAPGLGPATQMTSLGFTQSLTFYTRRRIAVGGPPDEMDYGRKHLPPTERERWFLDGAQDLKRLMSTPTPTYCVVRNSKFKDADVKQALAPLRGEVAEIVRNQRFTIIANRAAQKLTPPRPEFLKGKSLFATSPAAG